MRALARLCSGNPVINFLRSRGGGGVGRFGGDRGGGGGSSLKGMQPGGSLRSVNLDRVDLKPFDLRRVSTTPPLPTGTWTRGWWSSSGKTSFVSYDFQTIL